MKKINFSKGFTLIELLMVIVVISILATIVLAALGSARDKGGDAGVKSNLGGARSQAEVFFNTNTAVPNSYINVCTNGVIGGAQGMGLAVLFAAKAAGLSSYNTNQAGNIANATCNSGTNAWAVEVPLKLGGMWCVDSTNKAIPTAGTSLSSPTDYTCN